MKRAFSLVEILIVLVLIAVIMSFGLYWLSNYLYARKVEETTYQLYSTLKEYQLKAKTRENRAIVFLLKMTIKLWEYTGLILAIVKKMKSFSRKEGVSKLL